MLCSAKPPNEADKNLFYFCIAFLNQIYWIIGTLIGSIAGSLITFNTKGIDFAMTALFIVIFIEQWLSSNNHVPSLLGIAIAILTILVFGKNNMILPSMVLITVSLMLFKKQIEGGYSNE